MTNRTKAHRFLSVLVAVGLLLQTLAPAWVMMGPATAVAANNEPASGVTAVATTATTAPLAISRSQSSYTNGDGLTVTYTIHNSLPPTNAPAVTPGQTLTDTLAALDSFDLLGDPNSLRQVILVFQPTAAEVISASLPASLADGVYTFHLDDIPPLGQASVTIELDGPGSVTGPTELDNGAAGWGMVNGRSATATAPATTLWPSDMSAWLSCPVDANCADPYVIEQAAQLGQNPETLFAFVRDLSFESYGGSLRGARGTLWSAAGNSVDQASLLIALLRASGVPARYRSGLLADGDTETLILSMFPAPLGVLGYLPADNPFPQADPLQNQLLRQESSNHYWVEAYLPGLGWSDLDPSFATAQVGDRFVAAPDPTPLAELPAALRHSVNLRLKVEKYHPISGLTHSYPLDYTFSAVELVGEPVTFGHMVRTDNQSGMVFANLFHTYTPYLMLADADALLEGEPFQETITNFPLGTEIVTGEWLEIELRHPDGTVEGYEREIYDAIGYDARLNGGTISVGDGGRTDQPIISELTLFTALFAPSFVPVGVVDGEFAAAATAVTAGQSAYQQINQLAADGEIAPDEADELIAASQAISRMTRASQRVLLLQYAAAADFGTQRLGDSFLMRPYYDTPRVHLMAWETDTISGNHQVNFDLRRNNIRALPFPGQSLRGWQAFNAAYGLAAMTLESDLLQRFSPDAPVKSVANILSAAQEQGIPLEIVTPANLDDLAALTISNEAKARITADLLQNPNHFVLVPAAPVTLGDIETVGWLRGNIFSGEIIDISEEGLHIVSIEYALLLSDSLQEVAFAIIGFGQGFSGFTLSFLGDFLGRIPGDMKAAWSAALDGAEQWAMQISTEIAERMDHEWVEAYLNGAGVQGGGTFDYTVGSFSFAEFDWRVGGFNSGTSIAAAVIGSADPPLPPALAARLPEHQFHPPASGVLDVTGSGNTAVNATLQLDSFTAQGALTASWENAAQSGLPFAQLSAQGTLLVNGNTVGNGAIVANNGYLETSGAIAYQSMGAGGMGFYAPAVSGLGSGAFWGETAVTLTPANTAQLTLRGATAVLNGQIYSGTITLVTTNPIALAANGPAAAPHFASDANLSASDAALGLPPTSGSLTIGGTAVPLQNGLSLPNFNGSISISEAGPDADQVTLNGDAHYFHLATTPAASATTPGDPLTFQANISANFSDAYTVTLSAPGWAAHVAVDGSLTVTPTLTTAPGDYTLLVTAQSSLYPTAVAAVEHVVTVNPIQGVDVTIQPDPTYTIPWGEPDGAEGATNNGQVQIPEAAYRVQIVNHSSQPHTFDVTVSGLDADWLIFAGSAGQTTTQVTLPAGETTWLGLYVRPNTAVLPPPGDSHPFTVTAVAQTNPATTASDSATFVMPAVPFQRIWTEPPLLFALPETQADFTLHLHNLGNAPGSFDLAATLPSGWNLSGLQTPVTLAAGQAASQTITLAVPAAPLGSVQQVSFASPVPGQVYTQWATLNVRIVSANAAPIFAAATGCLADEAALAAALQTLAVSLVALEESCAEGCALPLRDQVVAAAQSAADYGRLLSPLGQTYTSLGAAAAHLAAQNSDADILAALPGITTAVTTLETELCTILDHRPTLRLTPWLDAALPGQTVNYDLQLTNRGRVTTTYAVTVTLPGGVQTFQQTVTPGATENTAVPTASADLGLQLLQAEVRALNTPLDYLTAQAEARLNVVDRFVQVTAVSADPPFVETGISSTTLQAEIANIAGVGLSGVVETAVVAPDGTPQWNDTIPLTLFGGPPALYDLAVVDTSGWATGVYTITADLLLDGQATAGGSGYGYLNVGQALNASHAVLPEIVAPGTVTVTTSITTAINDQLPIVNGQLPMGNGQLPMVNGQLPMGNGQLPMGNGQLPMVNGQLPMGNGQLPMVNEELSMTNEESSEITLTIDNLQLTIDNSFLRVEQDDPAIAYTGSWSSFSQNRASGGSYWRSTTAGDTAQLTFSGDWLNVGFLGGSYGGLVEISINGSSQGIFDLYRREDFTPINHTFADLGSSGPHTVTLTVLGSSNPVSLGNRVHLDYIDYRDNDPLGDGSFEQNDLRLLRSSNWVTVTHAAASGGSYIRSSAATAWLPFDGDSFSLQALAYNSAGQAQLFVDGVYLDTIDFFAPVAAGTAVTRTFSYANLGPGPHILQINTYRGTTTLDKITTPGTPPYIDPNPIPTGVTRYEEDHPAMRYDGNPYRTAPTNWWTYGVVASSGGYSMWNNTTNSTWQLDFEGVWLNVGFRSSANSGTAEIFIDGISQGLFDTANGVNSSINFTFGDLAPGPHTVEVVVASGLVMPDYMDVWDGTPLADGWYDAQLVDETSNQIQFGLKRWWGRTLNSYAYQGDYLNSGNNNNLWFIFAGNDLTLLGHNRAGSQLQVVIDGLNQGVFDMSPPPPSSNQPYALHFPDLGTGMHVVQVFAPSTARVDAFHVNPPDFASHTPQITWFDDAPSVNGPPAYSNRGIMSSIALGDLNNNGLVELVAPSSNGTLYVYRGDGQDAGGGTPLLWSTDVVGAAAEPALVDLTGDGNGEIIVVGALGTFAFTHDGTELWRNEDVTSLRSGGFSWGGPSVGNLDLDPQPEIAIAASNDALYVLDHQGNELWSVPVSSETPTTPVLADLNDDGRLDIIIGDGWDLRVYDYANSGQLLWSHTLTDTNSGGGAYGAPAVADLTGDGRPEIIINWGHRVQALRDDGTVLWTYTATNNDQFYPSPVTIADTTGDGQLNIITASAIGSTIIPNHHLLLVLNGDGTLLWQQEVADNTPSASGVAAQDLTGNGAWEILWNGSGDGFLILRGSDGQRLFNEPFTRSGTVLDYPTLGDVDGDGVADVVLGGEEGIFVFSHVGRWVNSRSIWNQHTYHISNINDNWSVPQTEPNSWELHNTYRTQTPEQNVAPAYQVDITHTVGMSNVTVLTGTFSTPPQGAPPQYVWQYQLEWYDPVNVITFASELADMQPGETRQINQGTEVTYRLPSGENRLTLPPLYVTAARILAVAPTEQMVGVGNTAVYTLTLSNPGQSDDLYSVNVAGLPAAWLSYPAQVNVPAQSGVEVALAVTVPAAAEVSDWPFLVTAVTSSGGEDMASASLSLFNGLAMVIDPPEQTAQTGTAVTYTLTLTNNQLAMVTYQLSAGGLAQVEMPDEIEIAGETAVAIPITVTGGVPGPLPFTITASGSGGSAAVDALFIASGAYGVGLALNPENGVGGSGTATEFALNVTNLGGVADSYALTVDAPAGWGAALEANGAAVDALNLPPHLFNSADLNVQLTPAVTAVPGLYPFAVTAVSQANSGVQATITGTVEVLPLGVVVAITPAARSLSPLESGIWQVTITNTGSVADSYDLAAAGVVGLTAEFSADTVTLNPGQSQTVQMSAGPLPLALAQEYLFWVTATSQTNEQISNKTEGAITFTGYEGLEVAWLPPSQTISGTFDSDFTLVVTNTGNTSAPVTLALSGAGLALDVALGHVSLPPQGVAYVPVRVVAAGPGAFVLLGTAVGSSVQVGETAVLTILGQQEQKNRFIYIPFVMRN